MKLSKNLATRRGGPVGADGATGRCGRDVFVASGFVRKFACAFFAPAASRAAANCRTPNFPAFHWTSMWHIRKHRPPWCCGLPGTNRPDLGEGVVQVFRRSQSPYTDARLCLIDLDATAAYELTNHGGHGECILNRERRGKSVSNLQGAGCRSHL